MGILTQRVDVLHILCKIHIKSLYDIIYFMTKISVYQEFNVSLVMDQFQRVSSIGFKDISLHS